MAFSTCLQTTKNILLNLHCYLLINQTKGDFPLPYHAWWRNVIYPAYWWCMDRL